MANTSFHSIFVPETLSNNLYMYTKNLYSGIYATDSNILHSLIITININDVEQKARDVLDSTNISSFMETINSSQEMFKEYVEGVTVIFEGVQQHSYIVNVYSKYADSVLASALNTFYTQDGAKNAEIFSRIIVSDDNISSGTLYTYLLTYTKNGFHTPVFDIYNNNECITLQKTIEPSLYTNPENVLQQIVAKIIFSVGGIDPTPVIDEQKYLEYVLTNATLTDLNTLFESKNKVVTIRNNFNKDFGSWLKSLVYLNYTFNEYNKTISQKEVSGNCIANGPFLYNNNMNQGVSYYYEIDIDPVFRVYTFSESSAQVSPSPITYHTHPLHGTREFRNLSTPSHSDLNAVFGISLENYMAMHFVSTIEGVYILSLNPNLMQRIVDIPNKMDVYVNFSNDNSLINHIANYLKYDWGNTKEDRINDARGYNNHIQNFRVNYPPNTNTDNFHEFPIVTQFKSWEEIESPGLDFFDVSVFMQENVYVLDSNEIREHAKVSEKYEYVKDKVIQLVDYVPYLRNNVSRDNSAFL